MNLSDSAQIWVNLFLLWLGFGVVVSLIALAILPRGEPKGLFRPLVIGVAASCIGPFLVSRIFRPEQFNPISPVGLFVSVLCALVLFLLYRSSLSLLEKIRDGGPNRPE